MSSSPVATPRQQRLPAAWRVLGYGFVAATLPYLALKLLWISGVMLGIPEHSPAHDGWAAQNAATAAMDVIGIVVVLALTHRWGLRLPAWLVLVPGWVGTGFLTGIVVIIPVGFAQSLLTTGQPVRMDGGLVENWTYAVIYTSFAFQGALLVAAFVGYARTRWADLLGRVAHEPASGATHEVQTVLATTGAVLAATVAALSLFQALWAPAGWHSTAWTFGNRLTIGVDGVLAALAAIGILGMTRSPLVRRLTRRIPFRALLAGTWAGSGSMFAWGFFRTVSLLSGADLSEQITLAERSLSFTALLAGHRPDRRLPGRRTPRRATALRGSTSTFVILWFSRCGSLHVLVDEGDDLLRVPAEIVVAVLEPPHSTDQLSKSPRTRQAERDNLHPALPGALLTGTPGRQAAR